ncbi:11975_t:CDS:2, partial [Racocetra persica]
NELAEINFKCDILLDINENDDDPQKLSKTIAKSLDQISIDRFDCNGQIKIVLNLRLNNASIHLKHSMLHKRSKRFGIDEIIKEEIKKNIHLSPSEIYHILENNYSNLTQKQVHAWWLILLKKEYVHDNNDQLNSAKIFLNKSGFKIILSNCNETIKFLGFITPFFEKLMKNKEIIVDFIYKTNALEYELYSIIGQFDDAGFAIAYLFVEGKNKKDRIATEILTLFFESLYNLGMNKVQFFLTDKDYKQISAAQKIWTNAKKILNNLKENLKEDLIENSIENLLDSSQQDSLNSAINSKSNNNDNESLQLFSKYKSILQDALEIIHDQENSENIK